MIGSAKQIEWAIQIVATRKEDIQSEYAKVTRRVENDKADYGDCPNEAMWLGAADKVKTELLGLLDKQTAKEIIDSRADSFRSIFSDAWTEAVGRPAKDHSYDVKHGLTGKVIHISGTYVQRYIAHMELSK